MNFNVETIKALSIQLYGEPIGTIYRLGGERFLFAFDPNYLATTKRPILSLSFKGRTGEIVTSPRPTAVRLPPFFSNLLPEGPLRTYLAKHAGVKIEREFFLLAVLGADLPGAVTATPVDHEIADALDHVKEKRRSQQPFRFSLAGLQLKFSAILERSGGLTIPASGMGGSWIVKLPSMQFANVPENEYVMLSLAHAAGLDVPHHRLVDLKEIAGLPEDIGHLQGKALAIERFDRTADGKRIHMEDFAQVFGLFSDDKYLKGSYANIASVLWMEAGEKDTFEFFNRLIFSILIGNGDMHLKNWSILYPNNHPTLAPCYDFLSTLPYIPEDTLALKFGNSRSLHVICKDQVRQFTETARLPTGPFLQRVTEMIDKIKEAWSHLPSRELLQPEIDRIIDQQIHKVRLH